MYCCARCKPKWMRLVDNIYPANAGDGLVKNNMDKLIFYGTTKTEKLDKIGQYFNKRLAYDVAHVKSRRGYLQLSIDAMDQLMKACHAQTAARAEDVHAQSVLIVLHLLRSFFVRLQLQTLLEQPDPSLQMLATQSFCKFASIKEDAPSYHRSYDFFIAKFASMCHSNHDDEQIRSQMRIAGLRSLQGVVKKTDSDQLQVNIWEPTHMEKIVPSFLYNMRDCSSQTSASEALLSSQSAINTTAADDQSESVHAFAEAAFRDLVSRATFGTIKAIVHPVLTHLDHHKLWTPTNFAYTIFKIIMTSCQAQYDYVVVQMLMAHLDKHLRSDARIKTAITDVLLSTVVIAATESVGPSVLEVFNTIVKHLKYSVELIRTMDSERVEQERKFQHALANTLGEFANHLPEYQKVDIMQFIMAKLPTSGKEGEHGLGTDDMRTTRRKPHIESLLLKAILEIALKYNSSLLSNALPDELLFPLLRLLQHYDAGIRLCSFKILLTLLDRHNNTRHLLTVRIWNEASLQQLARPPVGDVLAPDIIFIRKVVSGIHSALLLTALLPDNKVDNFEHLYAALMLLVIEVPDPELLVGHIALCLELQRRTVESHELLIPHKCAMHALIVAVSSACALCLPAPTSSALLSHVNATVESREKGARHLLPNIAFNRSNTQKCYPDSESAERVIWMLDIKQLGVGLAADARLREVLLAPVTLGPQRRPSQLQPLASFDEPDARSVSEISVALSTASSVADLLSGRPPLSDLSFHNIKTNIGATEANPEEKRAHADFVAHYRAVDFDSLVEAAERRAAETRERQEKLRELEKARLSRLQRTPQPPMLPLDKIEFPPMFVS